MSYEVLNSDFQEQLNLAKKLWQDYKTAKDAMEKANEQGDLDEISDKAASLSKIESQIKSMNDMEDDSEDISEEEIKKMISSSLKETKPYKASYDMPLGILHDEVAEPVVLNVISNLLNFATTKGTAPKERKDEDPNEFGVRLGDFMLMESYREAMAQEVDIIQRSYDDLKELLGKLDVEYISAHAANQNSIYNTADRNDYIAQTVHEFYREKILKGEEEYEFVKEWMKEFEIGIDFDITSIDGEAYQVRIKESENTSVPLADKGMGSIQMMILLLRLATIIRRNRRNKYIRPLVIIEEPEQNLHPKMQSKLAQLFFSLAAEDERCFFLIETHSEYLIRKTQVIVAKENYLDNDELSKMNSFKVYYLPSDDDSPYEMRYRLDGCFENDFGEGFFDEAENLAFQVL